MSPTTGRPAILNPPEVEGGNPPAVPDRGAPDGSAGEGGRAGLAARAWASSRRCRPVIVLTLALFIFVSITQDTFLTSQNLQNLMTAVAVLWLVALAQTFAMLAGGIDLSMGALAALVALFFAKVVGANVPDGVAVILALAAGTAFGALVNGTLIGKVKLSFFIVTLATATALGGVVLIWSGQKSILLSSDVLNHLALQKYLGIQAPIWIMGITLLVGLYVQRRTYFGRNLYAIGGSATAAQLSGIRVERTVMIVYGICGFCAALAGLGGAGQVGVASPTVNQTIALQAIAAVLLGGTSLFGGSGGIGGTALGVIFIGVLQNALALSGVETAWQEVVTGVILVAAVVAVPAATGQRRFGGFKRLFNRRSAVPTEETTGEAAVGHT